MSENNKIQEIIKESLENIRSIIDANTVIGTPMETSNGVTIIPVSKISMGFASGGLDFDGKKEAYVKINVDVEGYRAKREETLRALARRMAAKVQKYKKSVMLEPMNPYERRIIHSEIQNIEGVSTNSIGSENNRKIVIFLDNGNEY